MSARIGRFRYILFYLTLALMVCVAGLIGPSLAEAQCLSCGNDMCGCPAPDPVLETCPGPSLYFNDPCGGGYECCWTRFYCHDGSPASWFVGAEFMPLFRDGGGSFPIQSRGPAYIREFDTAGADLGAPIPDIILGTGDFDAELDPGVRLTIGYALGDWYRIEGSWRGGYSWSDSVTVRNNDPFYIDRSGNILDPAPAVPTAYGNMYSPFSNFGDPYGYVGTGDPLQDPFVSTGIIGVDFNKTASISFSSRMNDAELNLRRRLRMRRGGAVHGRHRATGEASFLVGLRYMDISETFNYRTVSDIPGRPTLNEVAVQTNNDMFGVQIGGLAQILVHDRAWVDMDIKGVAFFNQAGVETAYNANGPFGDNEDRATFMGDLSVTLNYQFAQAWTFRLGYNALWLSGVALATENFNADIDTLELGPANVNHSGNVAYHGPQIGLVWAR